MLPILTPGRTSDHTFLVLEVKGAIFTGDCVLGSGSVRFKDLHENIGSLRILLREFGAFNMILAKADENYSGTIYPRYGEVVKDGKNKVQETLNIASFVRIRLWNY